MEKKNKKFQNNNNKNKFFNKKHEKGVNIKKNYQKPSTTKFYNKSYNKFSNNKFSNNKSYKKPYNNKNYYKKNKKFQDKNNITNQPSFKSKGYKQKPFNRMEYKYNEYKKQDYKSKPFRRKSSFFKSNAPREKKFLKKKNYNYKKKQEFSKGSYSAKNKGFIKKHDYSFKNKNLNKFNNNNKFVKHNKNRVRKEINRIGGKKFSKTRFNKDFDKYNNESFIFKNFKQPLNVKRKLKVVTIKQLKQQRKNIKKKLKKLSREQLQKLNIVNQIVERFKFPKNNIYFKYKKLYLKKSLLKRNTFLLKKFLNNAVHRTISRRLNRRLRRRVKNDLCLPEIHYLQKVYRKWFSRKIIRWNSMSIALRFALYPTNEIFMYFLQKRMAIVSKGSFGILCHTNRKNMLFSIIDATGKVYTMASSGSIGIQFRPHKKSHITTKQIISRLRINLKLRSKLWQIPFLSFIKLQGDPFWFLKSVVRGSHECGLLIGDKNKKDVKWKKKLILNNLFLIIKKHYPTINLKKNKIGINFLRRITFAEKPIQLTVIIKKNKKAHNGTRKSKKRIVKRHLVSRAYTLSAVRKLAITYPYKKAYRLKLQSLHSSNLKNKNLFQAVTIRNVNFIKMQSIYNIFFQYYIKKNVIIVGKNYIKQNITLKPTSNLLKHFISNKISLIQIFKSYKKIELQKYLRFIIYISEKVFLWNFHKLIKLRFENFKNYFCFFEPLNLIKQNNSRNFTQLMKSSDTLSLFIKELKRGATGRGARKLLPKLFRIMFAYRYNFFSKIYKMYQKGFGVRDIRPVNIFHKNYISICQQLLKTSDFYKSLFFSDLMKYRRLYKLNYQKRIQVILKVEKRYQAKKNSYKYRIFKDIFITNYYLWERKQIHDRYHERLRYLRKFYFLKSKYNKLAYQYLYKKFLPVMNKKYFNYVIHLNGYDFYKEYSKIYSLYKELSLKYKLGDKVFIEDYTYIKLKKLLSKQQFQLARKWFTVEFVKRLAIYQKKKEKLKYFHISHKRCYIKNLNVLLYLNKEDINKKI